MVFVLVPCALEAALKSLAMHFSPVWHTQNNMITAYNCILVRDGRDLTSSDAALMFADAAGDVARALPPPGGQSCRPGWGRSRRTLRAVFA